MTRELPQAVRECYNLEKEMGKLLKMADIIEHPLSLMFRAGKNFVINGVDIFQRLNLAMQALSRADYLNFGLFLGEAFEEVVIKSPS